MSTREVPDAWARLMVARQFTKRDGSANITALAKAADVAVESVRRLVHGIGDPRPDTIAAVASQLGEREVHRLLERKVPLGEWEPPAESVYLSQAARDALDVLVRELGRSSKGTTDGTANKQAGGSPADELNNRRQGRNVTPAPPEDAAARRTGRKSRGELLRQQQDRDAED